MLYFHARKIVLEYFFRSKSLRRHNRGAYLAEPDSMPPSGSMKGKSLNRPVCSIRYRHDECAAVKVTPGEPAAYLKLLPHDHASL